MRGVHPVPILYIAVGQTNSVGASLLYVVLLPRRRPADDDEMAAGRPTLPVCIAV